MVCHCLFIWRFDLKVDSNKSAQSQKINIGDDGSSLIEHNITCSMPVFHVKILEVLTHWAVSDFVAAIGGKSLFYLILNATLRSGRNGSGQKHVSERYNA